MKSEQKQFFDVHFFVCCNEKFDREGNAVESCGPRGAKELRDQLKSWIREQGLHSRVRINQAGCLGRCSEGIVCVAYPKQEWMTQVRPESLEEIKGKILGWVHSVDTE